MRTDLLNAGQRIGVNPVNISIKGWLKRTRVAITASLKYLFALKCVKMIAGMHGARITSAEWDIERWMWKSTSASGIAPKRASGSAFFGSTPARISTNNGTTT